MLLHLMRQTRRRLGQIPTLPHLPA